MASSPPPLLPSTGSFYALSLLHLYLLHTLITPSISPFPPTPLSYFSLPVFILFVLFLFQTVFLSSSSLPSLFSSPFVSSSSLPFFLLLFFLLLFPLFPCSSLTVLLSRLPFRPLHHHLRLLLPRVSPPIHPSIHHTPSPPPINPSPHRPHNKCHQS